MKYKNASEWGREKAHKLGYADGGGIRSERTSYEVAQRGLKSNPPVTVLEDLAGGLSQSKAQNNALRDSLRERSLQKMRETGYGNLPDIDDRYR